MMNVLNHQKSKPSFNKGNCDKFSYRSFPAFQTIQIGEKRPHLKLYPCEGGSGRMTENGVSFGSLTAKYVSPVVYRSPITPRNNTQPVYQSTATTTAKSAGLLTTPLANADKNMFTTATTVAGGGSRSKTVSFTFDCSQTSTAVNNSLSSYFSSSLVKTTIADAAVPTNNFRTPQMLSNNNAPKVPAKNFSTFSSLWSSSSCNNVSGSGSVLKQNGTTQHTPKSTTSTGSGGNNHMILAITEGRGRARGEVGIAAIDTQRSYFILCQMSDTQTYANTLRKVNILNPTQVLVPNTLADQNQHHGQPSKLFELLSDTFPYITITTVQRKFFNDVDGLHQVDHLCLPEYSAARQLILRQKFYALAALGAVLKYAEYARNVIFTQKSVRIDYITMDDTMFIDVDTAQKLELVLNQNMQNQGAENTLFQVLNKCSTLGGERRLRALILQPPSQQCIIEDRLTCVSELLANVELMCRLKDVLSKLVDVEKLLSLHTQMSVYKEDPKAAELQMNYALLLKTTIEILPTLQSLLQNANSSFFGSAAESLDDVRYGQILHRIKQLFNDDAHSAKNFTVSQFQRCFAIKPQISDLLDVARVIYSELVGDFNNQVKDLSEKYKLPFVVRCLRNKGLVIQLSLPRSNKSATSGRRNFNVKNLPSIFVHVWQTRSTITMITKDLLFLKQRINQVFREIQLIGGVIVYEMLLDVRQYVGCLYKLCETIAELDLLVSLAQVSSRLNCVRPTFDQQTTRLKNSRHPILDYISTANHPVANNIYATVDKNFQLITGANMGGKSIYIRQVALLQIMAQIGCYVPAQVAQFRICDCLFSRIGFNDSIECNASSFVLEVKQMQYILSRLPTAGRSLVIIDELGRGTSSEEGTSIAWAITEQLLDNQLRPSSFVFFATHFHFLVKLSQSYSNVTNYYLETIAKDENDEMSTLIYTHKLIAGISQCSFYGLRLARSLAIPPSIINAAIEIATKLQLDIATNKHQQSTSQNFDQSDNMMKQQINNIVMTLLDCLDNGNLNTETVIETINYIRVSNFGTAAALFDNQCDFDASVLPGTEVADDYNDDSRNNNDYWLERAESNNNDCQSDLSCVAASTMNKHHHDVIYDSDCYSNQNDEITRSSNSTGNNTSTEHDGFRQKHHHDEDFRQYYDMMMTINQNRRSLVNYSATCSELSTTETESNNYFYSATPATDVAIEQQPPANAFSPNYFFAPNDDDLNYTS